MTYVLKNASGNFLLDWPSADLKFSASPANAKTFYSRAAAERAAKLYGGLTVAPFPTSFALVPANAVNPIPAEGSTHDGRRNET